MKPMSHGRIQRTQCLLFGTRNDTPSSGEIWEAPILPRASATVSQAPKPQSKQASPLASKSSLAWVGLPAELARPSGWCRRITPNRGLLQNRSFLKRRMQNAESDLSGTGFAHVDSVWRPDECTTWPGLTVRTRPFRPLRPGGCRIKTDVTDGCKVPAGSMDRSGGGEQVRTGSKSGDQPMLAQLGIGLVAIKLAAYRYERPLVKEKKFEHEGSRRQD
jgi:hypothetical protein